jgi:hypothetical protein
MIYSLNLYVYMENFEIIQKINKMDGLNKNKQRYSVINLIMYNIEIIVFFSCFLTFLFFFKLVRTFT